MGSISHFAVANRALCCIGMVACSLDSAVADRPASVEPSTALSKDFTVIARSNPLTKETVVYRANPDFSAGDVLWKVPKYFSSPFAVSCDGKTIVAQERFLPLNAKDDHIVLTFIREGKVIRQITVKQLLGSRDYLRRTLPIDRSKFKLRNVVSDFLQPTPIPLDSHKLSWGVGCLYGIDEHGFALVDSFAGFFIFDVGTATCVFPANNRIDPPPTR